MSARIGIILGHLSFVLIRTFPRIKRSNKRRRPPYWIADVARARSPPRFGKNGKDWAVMPKGGELRCNLRISITKPKCGILFRRGKLLWGYWKHKVLVSSGIVRHYSFKRQLSTMILSSSRSPSWWWAPGSSVTKCNPCHSMRQTYPCHPSIKFSLYLKKASLVSRNKEHFKKSSYVVPVSAIKFFILKPIRSLLI